MSKARADEEAMALADRTPSGGDEPLADMVAAAALARPDRRADDRPGVPSDRRNRLRGDDDLAWLRVVLGADDGGPPSELLARPSLDELHLLVPTQPPAVAAAALRRYDDDRSLADKAQGLAGRTVARLGLLRLVPGQQITLPRFVLVDDLARALGEPELLASVTVGTRRRNRKPVLQLLTPSGRTVGYAKVGWSPLSSALVTNEADALHLVAGRLPKWLRAPVVLHEQAWRGGVVTVSSPAVPDSRLLAKARRTHPTARPNRAVEAVVEAVADADRQGDGPIGELGLFDDWGHAGLADVVDLDAIRARHADTIVAAGLWHGDLTPWNLSVRGRTVTLWDWEFAGRGRPIGFDALHHAFEQVRRSRDGSNLAALTTMMATAGEILAPFTASGSQRPGTIDAIVDLYLCELAARELQLDGQRWRGGAVAGLGEVAAAALAGRQARWR